MKKYNESYTLEEMLNFSDKETEEWKRESESLLLSKVEISDVMLHTYLSDKSKELLKNELYTTVIETEKGALNISFFQKKAKIENLETAIPEFLKLIDKLIVKGIFGIGSLGTPFYITSPNNPEMVLLHFYAPVVKVGDLTYDQINELTTEQLNEALKDHI